MKSMKINLFIALFILWTSCTSQKHQYIIGIWQDAPGMAAGWSDNYQIFENGDFIYNYSQMNESKREISYSGKWQIDENNNIVFTILKKSFIEGGELLLIEGTEADYELQGGETKTTTLKEPEIKKFKLSNYGTDSSYFDLEIIHIGEQQYWKMRQDPNDYN